MRKRCETLEHGLRVDSMLVACCTSIIASKALRESVL